jgi:hypothetical protein
MLEPAEHVEDAVENADDVGMSTKLAEDVGDVGMSTDLVEDVGDVGKCSIKGCGYPICQAVKDGTELPSIECNHCGTKYHSICLPGWEEVIECNDSDIKHLCYRCHREDNSDFSDAGGWLLAEPF